MLEMSKGSLELFGPDVARTLLLGVCGVGKADIRLVGTRASPAGLKVISLSNNTEKIFGKAHEQIIGG
jgi:hypothetical protein